MQLYSIYRQVVCPYFMKSALRNLEPLLRNTLILTDEMTTRCEYESPATRCTHRYHVGILEETLKFTDVHVEARRCKSFHKHCHICLAIKHLLSLFASLYAVCPEPVVQTAPWIIAVAIIAALLVLGVIALLLLKLFLFIFVSCWA